MAVKKLTTISRYTGTSDDPKPTGVPIGSTFREYDTRIMWESYDGNRWRIKSTDDASENSEILLDLMEAALVELKRIRFGHELYLWEEEVESVD